MYRKELDTDFNDLFQINDKDNNPCNYCKSTHKIDKFCYDFCKKLNYIFIYTPTYFLSKDCLVNFKSKILNFNENLVKIPNTKNSTTSFKMNAAICHFSSLNTTESGHYICWQRYKDKWCEISDSQATFHDYFLKNLKDCYIMLLEKNEVESNKKSKHI